MRFLITGGLGFIGTHLAVNFLTKAHEVILYDNFSDPSGGALKNILYLTKRYSDEVDKGRLKIVPGDVRDFRALKQHMAGVDVVIHTAAQVAMVPSLKDPRTDFEVNALGSLNLLEAARLLGSDPIMAYTSTNKVYGTLEGLPLVEKETRWDYPEGSEHYDGITEDQPFDIGGPYGCSKAVGDMYFREYARTYGMRTFVFRMAAIYGELQYATEVHGWVGWFLKRAHEHKPVTIYGDGKQVRGVLHVSDLVRAFEMAINKINRVRGHAFNVGGDRGNSLSIIELLDFMRREFNIAPSEIGYADWRRIDQKCFIANCGKARRYFGWRQRVRKEDGIRRMYNWIRGVS